MLVWLSLCIGLTAYIGPNSQKKITNGSLLLQPQEEGEPASPSRESESEQPHWLLSRHGGGGGGNDSNDAQEAGDPFAHLVR